MTKDLLELEYLQYFYYMEYVIEAQSLSKKYQTLTVLKGVNLQLKAKEIVAIVGPSGAGKSTLLQILGTLDTPSPLPNQSLKLLGEDVNQMSRKALAAFRNSKLGFIFQFHELLPEFTALENVCLPAWIGKKDKRETEARAKSLLAKLGVGDRAQHKPSEMSGGEQQRVAVARALINEPSIIFADEPSGNLDSENAAQLHQLFFDLREELGCAFVIVTHNHELADQSDRKIVLSDGQIVT